MHGAAPLQATAQPISTLDELLAWAPGSLPDEELCVGSVPLAGQVWINQMISMLAPSLICFPRPHPMLQPAEGHAHPGTA